VITFDRNTHLVQTGGGFWQDWSTRSMNFVASASAVDIEFSVTNQAFDMGLDCVTVRGANGAGGCSVPEPSSLALLGVGLAGLGFSRRKNKKA
jgi:PEP-CTERM motif